MFVTCLQGFHYLDRTVDGRAFFVSGDQQGQAACVIGVGRHEVFNGHHHGGNGALHVRCTAPVEQVAFLGRGEWIVFPGGDISGRNHVGMPGKGENWPLRAPASPQVADLLKPQGFAFEAQFFEFFNHPVLTAFIFRGDGGATDEFLGVVEGAGH